MEFESSIRKYYDIAAELFSPEIQEAFKTIENEKIKIDDFEFLLDPVLKVYYFFNNNYILNFKFFISIAGTFVFQNSQHPKQTLRLLQVTWQGFRTAKQRICFLASSLKVYSRNRRNRRRSRFIGCVSFQFECEPPSIGVMFACCEKRRTFGRHPRKINLQVF